MNPEWAVKMVEIYGWLFIFSIAFLEEIIVPLPSTLIILVASSLAKNFFELIFLVSVPAAVGSTLGSLMVYYLGLYLGRKGLEMLNIDINEIEREFGKYITFVNLIILRAVPVVPISVVSGLAGLRKFPLWGYIIATFIGTLIRDIVITVVGFVMKESVISLSGSIEWIQIVTTTALLGIIGYLIFRNEKVKKSIYQFLEKVLSKTSPPQDSE